MSTNNKPWLNTYPDDVPEFVDIDQYANINEMFVKPFELYADNTAFVNMGHSLTYRDLNEKSDAFAAYLQNDLRPKRRSNRADDAKPSAISNHHSWRVEGRACCG